MPGRKTASFSREGIKQLAKNKPVVYTIYSNLGSVEYIGSAKLGNVQQRIVTHLPGNRDEISRGSQVKIRQYSRIDYARDAEARAIKAQQPRQNKRGK